MCHRLARVSIALVLVTLLLVAVTGCGFEASVTVNEDGSGTVGYAYVFPSALADLSQEGQDLDTAIEEGRPGAEEQDVTISKVTREDEEGIAWEAEFEEADQFGDAIERLNAALLASGGEGGSTDSPETPPFASGELEVSRGIFAVTYTLRIDYVPMDAGETSGSEEADQAAAAMAAGLKSQVTVTMPGEIKSTTGKINADDPTIATFEFPLYGSGGETLEVVAERTNWLTLYVLIGVALLLAVVGFVLSARRKGKAAKNAPATAGASPVAPAQLGSSSGLAFCGACGAARSGTDAFCQSCGAPLG